MFKIQYRNPQGRLVTAQFHDPAEIRKLADKARREVPDASVCQLRIRQVAVDEASGDFVWADCTADFTR